MNFDPNITKKMQDFINSDEETRNYEEAALILMQVSGNRVEYQNNISNLETKKPHILKRLRTYLEFRLASLTKAEVKEMAEKAEKIAANVPKEELRYRTGIRPDHQSLPDDIIAAYKEVNIILQKQKQLHLKIRTLALADAPCPDSELFPFVKEMIKLDKERLSKWELYDHYEFPSPKNSKQVSGK